MNQPNPAISAAPFSVKNLTPRSPEVDALGQSAARSSKRRGRGRVWVRLILLGMVLLLGVGVGMGSLAYRRARTEATRNEIVRDLALRPVSRIDFRTSLSAAGRVESHRKTMIQCQTERLTVSNEGKTISSGENSRVIEVVDEGKRVKKGDVLCRLDSSEYEEMVRTQQMKTEQARAALEQAQLNFDVAELAVNEYRQGLHDQNIQLMEGQIALAQSDVARATDRLRWTNDMLLKGYVPRAQKTSAERTLSQAQFDLMTGRTNLENFIKYVHPRTLKELQSEVEKRRYEVVANTQRVTRLSERLDHYRKMVECCTIRSPHDGLVIYATENRRRNTERLQPGVEVHQKQDLFYLPDLSEMEVITYLHESVARQVTAGMTAQIKIEALSDQILPGRVVSVGPLPVESPVWTTSDEVKYFVAIVKLNEVPADLLPGMSAEVEVDLTTSDDVLAIPAEAVAFEAGHDVCYVAGTDGLERREVTLGRSTRNYLEVKGGLTEGEAVVINPAKVNELDSLLTHPAEVARARANDAAEVSAFDAGPAGVQ